MDGPSKIEFGVAKKISITIMRLPRWKRRLPESEALMSPDVLIVLRVTSTYKFFAMPR
jgi:hypothetical protein